MRLFWDTVARVVTAAAAIGAAAFGLGLVTGNAALWLAGGMVTLVFGGAVPVAIAESYAIDHADWKWTFTYQARRLLSSPLLGERLVGRLVLVLIGGAALAMAALFAHFAFGWEVNR